MATTNHTSTFISFRENYWRRERARRGVTGASSSSSDSKKPKDSLNEGLASNAYDDEESLLGTAKYTLPPVWVDAKDACEGIIRWLQDALEQLEEAFKERLAVRFDESSYSTSDQEIEQVTQIMSRKFKEAEGKLREIGRVDKSIADAEVVVRKNVQRNLAVQLSQLVTQFRRAQKGYMSRVIGHRQTAGFDLDDSPNSSSSSAFLMTQEEEQENLSKKIHYRDAEIARLAKNIQELATVFKELATLVVEQGTILDRIDYNMDQVVDRTERGVLELEKAEQYQRSNRANYCIFILVVTIVILFALIVARVRG